MTRHLLPDGHAAAAVARSVVTEALAGRPDLDDIVLATSELVANAVAHGAPPVELHVDSGSDGARVTVVSTHTGGEPTARVAHQEASHGRGLALVARLAHDWGWEVRAGRMHVWATFDPPQP